MYFALTDSTQWNSTGEYDGVELADMYDFIVDYFESPETAVERRRVQALLKWWNA
jgi:hypothetical protein